MKPGRDHRNTPFPILTFFVWFQYLQFAKHFYVSAIQEAEIILDPIGGPSVWIPGPGVASLSDRQDGVTGIWRQRVSEGIRSSCGYPFVITLPCGRSVFVIHWLQYSSNVCLHFRYECNAVKMSDLVPVKEMVERMAENKLKQFIVRVGENWDFQSLISDEFMWFIGRGNPTFPLLSVFCWLCKRILSFSARY